MGSREGAVRASCAALGERCRNASQPRTCLLTALHTLVPPPYTQPSVHTTVAPSISFLTYFSPPSIPNQAPATCA